MKFAPPNILVGLAYTLLTVGMSVAIIPFVRLSIAMMQELPLMDCLPLLSLNLTVLALIALSGFMSYCLIKERHQKVVKIGAGILMIFFPIGTLLGVLTYRWVKPDWK